MELPPPDLPTAYQSGPSLPYAGHNNAIVQQYLSSYGFDQSPGILRRARLSGEQLVMTEYQHRALQPFTRTSTLQPGHVLLDVMPVGEPARPRKRKAATLRADDWEPYKERILDLHVMQDIPLPQVKQTIEEEYGFKAELRQYRSRISQWGKDKNVKLQEMQAIVRKRQRRKLVENHKGPLVFEVRGSQVDPHKVERWMKRHKVPDSLLYEPTPAASTPPDVGCRTISMPGSPAMSVISVCLAAAPIWSPTDRYDRSQTPRMSSLAQLISSIARSRTSGSTGQSPNLTHRSLSNLELTVFHDPTTSEIAVHVSTSCRRRQDELEYLWGCILTAQFTILGDPSEILGKLYDLGCVLLDQGRYKAAEDVAYKLIDSHQSRSDGSGRNAEMLSALMLFGQVLGRQGMYAKAEKVSRQILHDKDALAHQNEIALDCCLTLGLVLRDQEQFEEAEAVLRQALNIGEKGPGSNDLRRLEIVSCLGDIIMETGRLTEAEAMHRKTLAVKQEVFGQKHPVTLSSMYGLADVLRRQGRHIEAEELYRETIALQKKVLGPEHPETLLTMNNLAIVLDSQRRYEEAEELYKTAIVLSKKTRGLQHPGTLNSMQNLAYLLHRRGRYNEAEKLFLEIIALQKRALGLKHPRVRRCIERLKKLLAEQSRCDEVPYIE